MSSMNAVAAANDNNDDDNFRKRVVYLQAVDDGWRQVLADVDSLLKTFGSLTAHAATAELRSLVNIGKSQQSVRRNQLDSIYDANLANLQNGAQIEETRPVSHMSDFDWPPLVRSAWRSLTSTSSTCNNNNNNNQSSNGALNSITSGIGINVINNSNSINSSYADLVIGGSASNCCQLSKSLPNSAFFMNGSNDFSLSSLQAKLSLNTNTRNGCGADKWRAAEEQTTRRHSVFAAPIPDHHLAWLGCNAINNDRAVPRQGAGSNGFSRHSRLVSSSIDSRGSGGGLDEDSFTNSEDISHTDDNEDWDYESMLMFNKQQVRNNNNNNSLASRRQQQFSMRRASSPPSIPPYAFDSSVGGASLTHEKKTESHHLSSGLVCQYPRRILLGYTSDHHQQQGVVLSPAAAAIIRKNNINPSSSDFNLETTNARYIVIKSFTEQSIYSSLRHSVWCSTFRGNQRLDKIYRATTPAPVYLFFSVNNTGSFCGVAVMTSPVDFDCYAGCWSTPRWKGAFGVRWLYVKDIAFRDFRDIVLPEDGKPVCKSRDTQEVLPSCQGIKMLKIFHERKIYSSVFDDFDHYEQNDDKSRRQSLSIAPAAAEGQHHSLLAAAATSSSSATSMNLNLNLNNKGSGNHRAADDVVVHGQLAY